VIAGSTPFQGPERAAIFWTDPSESGTTSVHHASVVPETAAAYPFGGPGLTTEGTLMGIIIWLVVGGICGWLASMIMRTDAQQGIILNIVVGIVGAVIAGLLFGGGASLNNGITLETFLYSLLGAVILLAIVNLIRRGTVR
jgi:uncharacterized membrane protein YeaQ/YmgE (transglycosylase-associated protein family)